MQSRYISKRLRIAFALAVSIMLAFMPFSVNLVNYRVTLERNEANAIAPVFAGASAFIAEMAGAAGISSTQLVTTVVGMSAVGTGMVLANDAGVRYGNELSQNLNNLVDAADYPAWSTLSASEQENWGTKENYDSAKFNSLMAAYGMSDAYNRYQSAWGSGGAGNFSFSSQEQSSLEQIGDITDNWIQGLGNTYSEIQLALYDANEVYKYCGETPEVSTVNTGMQLPSGINSSISGTLANSCEIRFTGTYVKGISDNTVTYAYMTKGQSAYVFTCSTAPYNYFFAKGYTPGGYYDTASSVTINGNTFYYGDVSFLGQTLGTVTQSNISNIGEISDIHSGEIQNLCYLLLYGTYFVEPTVPNYPSDPQQIQSTTVIYYPVVVTEDTPWEDYTTQPDTPSEPSNPEEPDEPITPVDDLEGIAALIRKLNSDMNDGFDNFSFYNNGDLKVHDIGVFDELSDIYTLLLEISGKIVPNDVVDAPDIIGDFDFDELDNKVPDLLETISELAPFGSILLLSEMYSILANYTQIESPELVFPFDFGGFDDQNHELVIDLSWLDDIKPLINFLCIAMLIIAIANATIRIVEIEAAS